MTEFHESREPRPLARLQRWVSLALMILAIALHVPTLSAGMRSLIPHLGRRLDTLPLPGCSILGKFDATSSLDLSHLLSVCMLLSVLTLYRLSRGDNAPPPTTLDRAESEPSDPHERRTP